jgi:ElaB/YqjD/DUF883 family membrane-anchored ribosome-binding protein
MFNRLAIAAVAAGFSLVVAGAPLAFARMHFTTTNERLGALAQRAQSSLALTNAAEIQTQLREIITQAQAAKAAADEASGRPASGAEDKSVLATVGTEMDGVVASANRALAAAGADQRTALQDIQSRADRSVRAVQDRIRAQQAAASPAASPGTLPATGQAGGNSDLVWLLGGLGVFAILAGAGLAGKARRRPIA